MTKAPEAFFLVCLVFLQWIKKKVGNNITLIIKKHSKYTLLHLHLLACLPVWGAVESAWLCLVLLEKVLGLCIEIHMLTFLRRWLGLAGYPGPLWTRFSITHCNRCLVSPHGTSLGV